MPIADHLAAALLATGLAHATGGMAQAAPPLVPIPAIQGTGSASPHLGETLTTGGVVTAIFPGLKGFFLQDPTGDGDPATSDGIFVYVDAPIMPAGVAVGAHIRLAGTVAEFNGLTELIHPGAVTVRGGSAPPRPVDVSLPEPAWGGLERYEGMRVRIVSPMTVVQNSLLGRYGQLSLSAGGRLERATNRHPPGSPRAIALAAANQRGLLVLDDGASRQNPDPPPYLDEGGTLRTGDTVRGHLVGILDQGLAGNGTPATTGYRLHPTTTPAFYHRNPRPPSPARVGGTHKVASFNVHNYFNGDGRGGGFPTPRGATTAAGFERQRLKIISALAAIDADVVGLVEIENDGDGKDSALQDLVSGLNAVMGAGTYAAVADPVEGTGTDAIRVALIHKPDRLKPVGAARSDPAPVNNRPPLAQTFATPSGERLTVIVNHFKSKNCGSASGPDLDQGKGQGCYNARRMAQARQLSAFAAQIQSASGSRNVLLIGDFNAYGQEDPVRQLSAAGFNDLLAGRRQLQYSYVFNGEAGCLDHALASASLAPQVSGVAHWHINADEPALLDDRQAECFDCPPGPGAGTPYRSSDHDPLLLGLNLTGRAGAPAARPQRRHP